MSHLVQEILDATNQARSSQRSPLLEELGGESTLLGNVAELTSSPVAGVACIALAAQWETLTDSTAASSFIATAFKGCGDAVLSEVTDAITALPPTTSAGIAPALLSVLDSNADPTRSAYAGELLVTLATAEAVGWATVTPSILGCDPTTQTWPAAEINMRSAFRIAISHPQDAAGVETFLHAMANNPTNAADANFLLGSIAFHSADDATTPDEIDHVLEQAASRFDAAIESDSEHDDSRFMSSLTHLILGVRNRDEAGELLGATESLLEAAGRIVRFGPPGPTSTGLPTSTRAAWVQVADLASHAIIAATADRDTTSAYEVLQAALQAQRFAMSVEVGGKIWVDSINDSFIRDEALIDSARRIVQREEPGQFADELGALIDRFEALRGKAEAGVPATREALLDALVAMCLDEGSGTIAGLFADLAQNEMLGTPEFEAALDRVLQPLRDDPLVPDETLRDLTLAAVYVLGYARRKTDATRRDGGFRDLANTDVIKPLEHHLQDDIGQAIAVTLLGSGWTDERVNMSGGRADGRLTVRRTHLPFEFKAEPNDASPEALQRYVKQADRYTGGAAPCAFLVVLDTTMASERYNDIAAQSWTVSIAPSDTIGRTRHVITVAIPANMPNPSEHSKRKHPPGTSP